jgi:DNA modification methylase
VSPYFALRSYRDVAWVMGPDGQLQPEQVHYAGQIGSEPTPQAFLEALWSVLGECWRVLKPTGSCWVNLGDKRAGSGGPNGNGGLTGVPVSKLGASDRYATARATAPTLYTRAAFGRPKSKMLLPHRFAIGCEDGLADPEGKGWIVRQDVCWQKVNGLPESVTDRCRDSHEYWFHLTKSERYFSAVDEVREPHSDPDRISARPEAGGHRRGGVANNGFGLEGDRDRLYNPLGKLPSSVWPVASEPLIVPEAVQQHYDLPDHFAAFPQELPRRIILGWSPSGICTACGEGRRPVVEKELRTLHTQSNSRSGKHLPGDPRAHQRVADDPIHGATRNVGENVATITGYTCSCMDPETGGDFFTPPSTRPAVVLDPFAGTGTTCGVARALGRYGVGLDLSADYLRLARWRIWESGAFQKTAGRTWRERQGVLM